MCGRYVSPEAAAIERAFRIVRSEGDPFPARWNVAPSTQVPVLLRDPAGDGLVLTQMRWGLVPHWWSQPRLPTACFNARSEEAGRKPMWRDAFLRSRCLLPAAGWYEWALLGPQDPSLPEGRQKRTPCYFRLASGEMAAFAGVYAKWTHPDGQVLASCALLTCAAAGEIAKIHDRMPVVLDAEAQAAWLDPANDSGAKLDAILATARSDVVWHPVGPAVSNVRNEGPELVVPVAGGR